MVISTHKNGETPLCANTNGVSMSATVCKETNMNIVAKSDYNFQGFAFHPVAASGSIWFTSTELAKALGYKKTDAISQIYARNADEFSESMSLTLNMKVNGINNSLRNKSVRVYSLRGAHLVAMFATTTKAKEFRRWVLDILDREVEQGNVNPIFNYGMDFFDKYRWIVGDKALSAPWFYSPEMLTTNGDYPNPCGRLLADMKNAGYSVEAAIFQLQALQHHLCLCLRKIDRVQQAVTH